MLEVLPNLLPGFGWLTANDAFAALVEICGWDGDQSEFNRIEQERAVPPDLVELGVIADFDRLNDGNPEWMRFEGI